MSEQNEKLRSATDWFLLICIKNTCFLNQALLQNTKKHAHILLPGNEQTGSPLKTQTLADLSLQSSTHTHRETIKKERKCPNFINLLCNPNAVHFQKCYVLFEDLLHIE